MTEALSGIFGRFGRKPARQKQVFNPREINQGQAIGERDRILAQLGKQRRATLLSQLSQANIGRKQLGAGV